MTTPTARLSTALAGRYMIERELDAGGMVTQPNKSSAHYLGEVRRCFLGVPRH